ncbi:MAG: DUF4920 domain-containing protein [bacterium]|nr:DUF4920 domain-containing protein [bacterium]
MRTMVLIVTLVATLAASAALAGETKTYGKGVAGADTVKVSDLLANPEAWVGKTIRVQGKAVGVCEHRGCWVNLASDVEGQTVRVKVKDGEIVFPPAMQGDMVIAEGVWTANQLDMETTKKVCEHQAKEKGETFDPNSVTSCMTLYQLSGTGAVATKN